MRIAGITRDSYVNGPGRRNVLHVQGCTIGCPGCFNKHTWPESGGEEISRLDAASALLAGNPDGVTISGGEPMEQWLDIKLMIKSMLTLNRGPSDEFKELSVVIFTGWTKERLEKSGYLEDMRMPYFMNETLVSMVISGPYVEKLACNKPLISSSNQEIIYINPAYEQTDLTNLPRVEVSCGEDGLVKITGLPDKSTLDELRRVQ